MTVREAQRRVGSREFAEWLAEWRLRAEDEERARQRAKVEQRQGARLDR